MSGFRHLTARLDPAHMDISASKRRMRSRKPPHGFQGCQGAPTAAARSRGNRSPRFECSPHVPAGSRISCRPRFARCDMTAPVASGWSGCRVGLAPTGKRRLCTAHANNRLPHCNKRRCHSITSSARSRNDSGIVSPMVLAVLRLITSSNLLDCTTGKSAGFSPLRIRPT
jgi:hypothetical protein